jgi:hypothetical protein
LLIDHVDAILYITILSSVGKLKINERGIKFHHLGRLVECRRKITLNGSLNVAFVSVPDIYAEIEAPPLFKDANYPLKLN